jgi:hypothetical protein
MRDWLGTTPYQGLDIWSGGRCGFASFPSLVKGGQARSAGVVCSKMRSHLIDAREALRINRYCSSLNRPPQLSLREGIPALLRRGIGKAEPFLVALMSDQKTRSFARFETCVNGNELGGSHFRESEHLESLALAAYSFRRQPRQLLPRGQKVDGRA